MSWINLYISNTYKMSIMGKKSQVLKKDLKGAGKYNSYDKELEKALSSVKLKDFVNVFASHLKEEHRIEPEKIAALFGRTIPRNDLLPISIFGNEELGCLETIVKYLKDEFNLRFHDIAMILNRNDRTIWATYKSACRKRKQKLIAKESKFFVPVSIFADRKLSVLEAIISYLKDNYNLRYSEIAVLLNRDERNIWAVYNKALKKKNGK